MPNYPIVEPRNGRSPEYKAHLEAILESGVCPFCPGGDTIEKQERLLENEHWIVSKNAHPLKDTAHHLVFIPKRHVEIRTDLSADELIALSSLEREVRLLLGITSSALYGRDGDPMVTGATVAHLHFQLIAPEGSVMVLFGPAPV